MFVVYTDRRMFFSFSNLRNRCVIVGFIEWRCLLKIGIEQIFGYEVKVEVELPEEAVQRHRVLLEALVAEYVLAPAEVVIDREFRLVRNVLPEDDNDVFV